MRLNAKLLNQGATVNSFYYVYSIGIARGETAEIVVQLMNDSPNAATRYIPAEGAVVTITIPRMDVVASVSGNARAVTNPTIERQAVQAFDGDRSIWKIPLTAQETSQMASSSLKIKVQEGSEVRIASVQRAIRIVDEE